MSSERSVTYVSGPDRDYLVGVAGFEPATPSSRTRCASRLGVDSNRLHHPFPSLPRTPSAPCRAWRRALPSRYGPPVELKNKVMVTIKEQEEIQYLERLFKRYVYNLAR